MKRKFTFNSFLYFCIFLILLIIIIGTFLVFVVDLFSAEKSDVKSTVAEQIQFDNQEIYKKLGKIRSVTKDGIPLVISVYFPFDKDDTEFYEEISVKNESIKSMISGFFVNYTLDEIKTKGETFVKSELLKKINGKLVLSQIKEIYFEEYVFFD